MNPTATLFHYRKSDSIEINDCCASFALERISIASIASRPLPNNIPLYVFMYEYVYVHSQVLYYSETSNVTRELLQFN